MKIDLTKTEADIVIEALGYRIGNDMVWRREMSMGVVAGIMLKMSGEPKGIECNGAGEKITLPTPKEEPAPITIGAHIPNGSHSAIAVPFIPPPNRVALPLAELTPVVIAELVKLPDNHVEKLIAKVGGRKRTAPLAESVRQVLFAILSGSRSVDDVAKAVGKTKATAATLLSDLKRNTGHAWREVDGLRAWAQQNYPNDYPKSELPPQPSVVRAVKTKTEADILSSLPAAVAPRKRVDKIEEPIFKPSSFITEPVGGNVAVKPWESEAVEIGKTLREPFSLLDLESRLDGRANQRAGQWLADWKARGWVTTSSFQQYRRSASFGHR